MSMRVTHTRGDIIKTLLVTVEDNIVANVCAFDRCLFAKLGFNSARE